MKLEDTECIHKNRNCINCGCMCTLCSEKRQDSEKQAERLKDKYKLRNLSTTTETK